MGNDISAETLAVQIGHFTDAQNGAIVPPVAPSTTFARDAEGKLPAGLRYSRYGNPTVILAEQTLAKLEGGKEARLFASGLAACAAILGTIRAGQHILAPRIMYHGAQDLMRRIAAAHGAELGFFDAADPNGLRAGLRANTAMVWIESPINPTWDVIDIAAAAEAAHAAGAILVIDSSVAPPVTTRPLALGADIVFHSASKYLNGHSDVMAGVLVTNALDARWQDVIETRNLTGGVLGAFEAWLLIRGLRTLFLRFARSSANALAIARHFERHPMVEAVLYPGLESHPGHAVAKRQMTNGFGGMLSIKVRGGFDEAQLVWRSLRVFLSAASLGGVESLAEHRAAVESPNSVVPRNLLRLSAGIESADDLIADLAQALDRLGASRPKA
ncbi:MAG: aminotransferase class I/II-fold pyridoxal phosphate-dependent enzyme [Alphaproteobacteria bacterium]|nr:aminotransferase class I/II-fold pyridoxal phosphate-dependent enzyme [Alphaproteobacteria bacterium]